MLSPKFVTVIATLLFLNFFSRLERHPLHVSTTEVNFNAKEKTLEVSCRIFSDDFESVLSKNYKQKTDLSHPAFKKAMDEMIKKYLNTHLQVKANGKPVVLTYLGFEIDHEATNIYLEAEQISAVKSMEVNDTILYDLFDDQMSIVHLVNGKVRKSSKILYPDKSFAATF